MEQLSALRSVEASGAPPYVDFSVWCPHANRLRRRITMQGLTLNRDGSFVQEELKGPADFKSWKECYIIFKNAAIMSDVGSTFHRSNESGHQEWHRKHFASED